jgi:hypothetical protein
VTNHRLDAPPRRAASRAVSVLLLGCALAGAAPGCFAGVVSITPINSRTNDQYRWLIPDAVIVGGLGISALATEGDTRFNLAMTTGVWALLTVIGVGFLRIYDPEPAAAPQYRVAPPVALRSVSAARPFRSDLRLW